MFKFSFLFLIVLGTLCLESPVCFALRSKLPCRLRNSDACKNPKNFIKDKKDGCAGPQTNCRQKFCRSACLGETEPTRESDVYRLCQVNCDPQEITSFSRKERQLFQERFEDKTLKRKHELNAYIDTLLSRLPWCEGECDYGESFPNSCDNKHAKAADHWSVCAQNCYFIKDIKDHADQCVAQSAPPRKPVYNRPAPPPPAKRLSYPAS